MLTQAEFVNWQNYHTSLFPKFAEWFLGMLGNQKETDEERDARELRGKVWFDALNRFDSDAVMAASVSLYKLPKDEKPKWFDDHLSTLLEILNRPKARPEQLRKAIQCEICQDTGIVEVTAVPGTALFTAGGVPMPHGKFCAVDCNCEKAVWYREDYQGPRRRRFDRNAMVLRLPRPASRSWEIIAEMRERGERAKADAWERFLNGGRMPRLSIQTIEE